MTNLLTRTAATLTVLAALISAPARAETVRIAFIDPTSGTFSGLTQTIRRNINESIALLAEREKWPADFQVEVVAFDSKSSPQEALIQLKAATDQGFRYVMQGLSSSVAAALIEGVNKHNERNPGKEVLYLNYNSSDPDLTNSKCSFWHFRFEPHTDMRTEALTSFLAQDASVKKIYLFGPNYSMGQQYSRATREYMKRRKPSVEIVGEDLVPLGQVKDFSPYVAKIKASGADTVIASTFGPDLVGLIKAANDANLKATLFAHNGGNQGVAEALSTTRLDRAMTLVLWTPNNPQGGGRELLDSFRKKYPQDDMNTPNVFNVLAMLTTAIRQAKTTDPVKVALAMEGMKIKGLADDVEMRKSDHQSQQPMYLTRFAKADGKEVKYDTDRTGYGWKVVQRFDSYVASQPTSCQMKRPVR